MRKKPTTPRQRTANKRQPAKRQPATATLEARAEKIISDVDEYDADTRRAVKVALTDLRFHREGGWSQVGLEQPKSGAATAQTRLRELIGQAEAGEPVFDVAEIGESYVKAARLIYEVITEPNNIPQFVYEAVTTALDEAQRRIGVELWIEVDERMESSGYSLERMARLFKNHSMEEIELEPKKELAEMLEEVLNHPDCPEEIADGINKGASALSNRLNEGACRATRTAPYFHALIAQDKLRAS